MPIDPEMLAQLHEDLKAVGATVGVAESLTGGLVTAALTSTPGASASIRGGLVVYATDLKATLADVDAALLAEKGAVDPGVATALALGARLKLGATIGIGVTGVAGPEPQDGQEVGTIYLASSTEYSSHVEEWHVDGDRSGIRAAAVDLCVELLADIAADMVDDLGAELVDEATAPDPAGESHRDLDR